MKIVALLSIMLILWSLYGFFASRVESPKYSVVRKMKGYEVRKYGSRIFAQTTVVGPYEQSMGSGFSIVAGYIFGANEKKESIAMTAPVTIQNSQSEKIAMTAPVLTQNQGDTSTISFSMPEKYTMESLPKPNDSRVILSEIPEQKMAVITFSGYRTQTRIMKKEAELVDLLSRDGIQTKGAPLYAGYNAPGTPPWMTRNEIMIEIQ